MRRLIDINTVSLSWQERVLAIVLVSLLLLSGFVIGAVLLNFAVIVGQGYGG